VTTLDDLELELRKLPGVRATGFAEREDVLLVQIHVGEEETEAALPLQATRIAYRHSDRPVAVELVRWRTRDVHAHAPDIAGHVESGPTIAAPTAAEAAPPPPPPVTRPESARVDAGAMPTAFTGAPHTRTDVPPPPAAPPPRRETAPVAPPTPSVDEQSFVTRQPPPAPAPQRGPAPEPEPAPPRPAPAASTGAGRVNRRSGSGSDEDRVRLLAVLTFPETDELEVHLTLQGRRTIGRAAASRGLLASVEATLDALGAFVPGLAYQPAWARTLETSTGEGFLVAAGLAGPENDGPRHGLASGSSAIEAAARATLQALNRSIALEIAATREHHHGESA
jgi:hypothetical protein